tara:strand:+ start:680 stop:937 length:258 start_codon:yes stop_codon:yes gene_type:complete
MKIVNLSLKVILSLILVGIVLFYLTGYDSAFEADQLCHSNLSEYENPTGNYGCDHDTETHQWILYNKENNLEPAKILKKFRYKFL